MPFTKCQVLTNSRTFGTCGRPARFYFVETWFDQRQKLTPACTTCRKKFREGAQVFQACHLCGLPLPDDTIKSMFPNQELCKCYWCGYHHRSERLPCAND